MRGEAAEVKSFFDKMGTNIEIWDVEIRAFFEALGVRETLKKNGLPSGILYKTLGQAVKSYLWTFIQGTIATDIIETQKG